MLDVWEGYQPPVECIPAFRGDLGINDLDHATADHPWFNTPVVHDNELSYRNIKNLDQLQTLPKTERSPPDALPESANAKTKAQWQAQEVLNVTMQGKPINANRAFIGEGVLVWGARTLDGNSLDWRCINVRRTMIMLEASCRLAAKAMVFEPNVADTWVSIKRMIQNFLTGIWKRGGLAGAVPDDAFSVHVGLGETMTPEDLLAGILRVTVLVAINRPAEFIEIAFQQQMQKSCARSAERNTPHINPGGVKNVGSR